MTSNLILAIVRAPDRVYWASFFNAPCLSRQLRHALIACLLIVLAGCNRETPTKYSWDTPWTVELVSSDVKVVLKAPFGAFNIHRESDIDYVNLTAKGISSVTMEYHFASRLPYQLWKNLPNKQGDDIYTRTGVAPIGHGKDSALIMKKVHFDVFRDASKRGKEVSLP